MKSNWSQGTCYYTFESFDPTETDARIFTRKGGFSRGPYDSFNLGGTNGDRPEDVRANHELLFQVLGRPPESRFDVWQVHGTTIRFGDQPRPADQKHQPADGIFTDNPEVTLVMRFADCVPIVFHDPVKKVVGIAHGGWQGTLLKVAAEAVNAANQRYGSQPENWRVGIGPAICADCYRVGPEVLEQYQRAWGSVANAFFSLKPDGWHLDLWKANEWVLRQAGVTQIEQSGICTAEHLDDWYSYRKERGVTGRFAVVIALSHDSRETQSADR